MRELTTPVARLVQGSLYTPQTKDFSGNPYVIKSGPNAGQPGQRYYIGVAIPKGPERHWSETEWGRELWAEGHVIPNAGSKPDFAWKVEDGDSPNHRDKEGWPGHWVLRCTQPYPIRLYRMEGSDPVKFEEPDAIKPGYYVQVALKVEFNGDNRKPGITLKPGMVCLVGYGAVINLGVDVSAAGFGRAALPPGASATPLGGFTAPAAAPAAPPAYTPPPVTQAAPPAPPPTGVTPHPGILNVPAPPPPAPVHQLTAKANGATYEQLVAAGWTDALLVQNGLMLP